MNRSQKKVLIGAATVVLFLTLFPPFHFTIQTMEHNLGHSFLFMPPKWNDSFKGSVNANLLLVEICAAAVIGGLVALAFKDK